MEQAMTTPKERITVNCIGAGRWGPNVVRAFTHLPDVRVKLVCDRDEGRLDLVRNRIPGIETTTDLEQALDDSEADAVAIATPVDTHFELARRAITAGKHVLVEKPLCKSVTQCEELIAGARMRHSVLAVGHVFLFNPGIQKVREYIASGELGRIFYIHATRTNLGPVRTDVNALWDLASHDLSIFGYWLGQSPVSVSVTGQRYISRNVDDVVTASFSYPDGVTAFAYASWLNPRKVREITVVGERKMVVWNDMDLTEPVRIYDRSIALDEELQYSDSFASFQATVREGDVVIPRVAGGESLVAQCAHFVECIRTGATPVNNARMALSVVRTLTAADVSLAHHGHAVPVDREVLRGRDALSDEIVWSQATAERLVNRLKDTSHERNERVAVGRIGH